MFPHENQTTAATLQQNEKSKLLVEASRSEQAHT
jgi:hypothetical protein